MGELVGPRRNRVDPYGDVVAMDLRGAWTGNRGILHRGPDVVRHHAGSAWIVCVLEFRGRRIPQWAAGHYTPLFFHDEAVALAAGHRPCAECRRPAFRAFVESVNPERPPRAPELDRLLHAQRWQPRVGRRLHDQPWAQLPDGTFVARDRGPALVLGDTLVDWTRSGYRQAGARPRTGSATVLTPPATLHALTAGYPVQIDTIASRLAGQTRSSTDGSSS
ncbi:MAG TPA: hypothetical protein VIU11_12030 [Nakamurella sp.]